MRAAGTPVFGAVNTYGFAHIVECQPLGQHKLQLQPGINRLTGQHFVRNTATDTNTPGIDGLLHKTGFFERDHHAGVKLFPYAGHGGKYGGRNFTHIFGNGFRVFHEVEFGAGVKREILAAHALSDMAQGQKAHALVVHSLRNQGVVAVDGKHQALV